MMRRTILVLLLAGFAQAQQFSPDALERLDRARAAMNRNQHEEAISEYKRVLKTYPNCVECYFKLVVLYQRIGAHKDSLESARKALEVAPNDLWRAIAYTGIGVATSSLAQAGKAKHDDAERAFRTALQLDPNEPLTYFNLGAELMRSGHDAEGVDLLNEFLKRTPSPEDPNAKTARNLIDNPRRARENYAPVEFSLVTRDGEHVTFDSIKGKVVLLDFWATWCQPCVQSVPALQRLSKKYAKEQFQLISISADRNEQAWQSFLSSHRMEWAHTLDRDGKVQNMFHIRAFPTYILIDAEGIQRTYVTGSGFQSEAQVDEAVKRAFKNTPRVVAASASTPAPDLPARIPATPTPVTTAQAVPAAPAPVAPVPAPSPNDPETLNITSSPEGADIYLDQNFIGNAPAMVKLTAGQHNLRLTLPGYHVWTRPITAQNGSEARVNANMVKSVPTTIVGRVLWNEQPLAGIPVFARECGPAMEPRFGPGTTDEQGRYRIEGVPDGRICLDPRPANAQTYWNANGSFFDARAGQETTAPDTHLCKLYVPVSPAAGSTSGVRPTLKWNPFPEAVAYSVQIWHAGPTNFQNVFRRADVTATTVQADTDIPSGEYYWRVDALNKAGHAIGCNYPIRFSVATN